MLLSILLDAAATAAPAVPPGLGELQGLLSILAPYGPAAVLAGLYFFFAKKPTGADDALKPLLAEITKLRGQVDELLAERDAREKTAERERIVRESTAAAVAAATAGRNTGEFRREPTEPGR